MPLKVKAGQLIFVIDIGETKNLTANLYYFQRQTNQLSDQVVAITI